MRTPKPWYWAARSAWYVTIDGQRHKLAEGKANKTQATVEFHRLMHARNHPAPAAVAPGEPAPGLLAGQVCTLYIAHAQAHLAPLTAEWYARHLNSFMAFGGAIPAEAVRPHHLATWTDRSAWGPSTRSGAITAVKRAFAWAAKQGHIAADPIKATEKPAIRARETILTPEQIAALDAAVPDAPFRDLLTALRETGARPSEVAAWEARKTDAQNRILCEIDLDNRVIRQWGKTSRATRKLRQVHLTPVMVDLLRRKIAENPEGPVFRNNLGKPWTRHAMACRFADLRVKLGLGKEATAETFRHVFITDALENGVPIATVAELAGHASTAMISRHYSKLAQRHQHLQDALAKVRPEIKDPSRSGPEGPNRS